MKTQAQETNISENFDNIASLQGTEAKEMDVKERSPQASKSGIKAIPGRMKGLCLNCDDRALCQFPIVDGGVWYCEEYC